MREIIMNANHWTEEKLIVQNILTLFFSYIKYGKKSSCKFIESLVSRQKVVRTTKDLKDTRNAIPSKENVKGL